MIILFNTNFIRDTHLSCKDICKEELITLCQVQLSHSKTQDIKKLACLYNVGL